MKTHEFDGISFFSGLVAAVIGAVYLIPRPGRIVDVLVEAVRWAGPVLLLAIGLAVIVGALTSARRDEGEKGKEG